MEQITNNGKGSRLFNALNIAFLTGVMLLALYPCYYVLMASVSDPVQVSNSGGWLWFPKGFGMYSYMDVLKSRLIWIGYRNTLFYAVCGGVLSVFVTVMAAFGLSRKTLPGKNILLFLIMVTMYFSGGLIPTYLVVKAFGLIDTPFAMIIPGLVSTYNLIITITYFRGLPYELEEAAKIDGANDYTILFRIMMPLATPIISVISLYYMVAIWNNYFTGLIYLNNRSLYSLQMVLREILIQNDTNAIAANSDMQVYAENVKYATIVVSTIPILCVYPFLQKYFTKGVMIGAIKQ
ncbi:MAG: carbohydrate ABC transporter permease [Firmicutes bacterium]|nr:carbohydrate ABC transporter permease [Bacillota bacterium]